METFIKVITPLKSFQAYADGACRGNGKKNSLSGIGGVIFNPKGEQIAVISNYLGEGFTNNVAEYQSLIQTLKKCIEMNIKQLIIYMDSKLVVEQIKGNWKIKKQHLNLLNKQSKLLINNFETFQIQHIPRENNSIADNLANEAINNNNLKKQNY